MLLGEPLDTFRQPRSANWGTLRGITRSANDVAPRWRKALTRKRGRSSAV